MTLRKTTLIITLGLVTALSVLASGLHATTTSAYSKSNQISDAVFGNYRTMNQAQIQNFINAFPNSCLLSKNYPSGLSPVTFDEPLSYFSYGSDTSPARIIWKSSQFYKINPQVLLATLEKEQNLITGNQGCAVWRYNSAMGYNCPDGSENALKDYADIKIYNTCVAQKSNAGFSRQVNHAAWQLSFDSHRAYGDLAWMGDGATYYYGRMTKGWRARINGGTKSYYDGYTVINGQSVYLANGSTAALYNYTPHFSNFSEIFTKWFGSTDSTTPRFKFERLLGTSSSVMKTSSTSLGSYTKTIVNGKYIYVFFYDATKKNLQYATWNGSKWTNQILDGAGSKKAGATSHDVGKGIDGIMKNGEVQLYYSDATSGDLRHAWTENGRWKLETLDGSSSSISSRNANVGQNPKVLLYHNNLQLYYYDQTNGSMRHAWWPGDGRWHFETMDGTAGSLGKSTANVGSEVEAFIYKGGLQLYYYDQTNGSMRHAWWPGDGRWHFETMDGTAGSLGKSTANIGTSISAILYKGQPQIYYHNKTTGELKHAWWPGDGRWHFETMDGNSTSVFSNIINAGSQVIAKQVKDTLFIFYYDSLNGAWRTAYWDNGAWYDFNLDGGSASQSGSSAAVGGQLSVGVYGSNSIQVFYRDSAGGLKHAWASVR